MARRNCYTGKYSITKEEYLSAKYYALRYNQWLGEYNALKDSVGAIVSDGMPHAINNISNPTERLATRRAELRAKMAVVERAAKEADPEIGKYIFIMATTPDMTFERLCAMYDVPCGRDMFYDRRRKFLYILAQNL